MLSALLTTKGAQSPFCPHLKDYLSCKQTTLKWWECGSVLTKTTASVGNGCFLFSLSLSNIALEAISLAFFLFLQSRERSRVYCIEKPTLDFRKKFSDTSSSWLFILHKERPLRPLDG